MDTGLIIGILLMLALAGFIAYRILKTPSRTNVGGVKRPGEGDNQHPR